MEVRGRKRGGDASGFGTPPRRAQRIHSRTVRAGVVQLLDLRRHRVLIRSPMVGTFYRAPEPGASPFVEPGRRSKPDTIVCIIEVMKLMNSVAAEARGPSTQICWRRRRVETGQPLVAIGRT